MKWHAKFLNIFNTNNIIFYYCHFLSPILPNSISHSSMEEGKSTQQQLELAAYRNRYNRLLLAFKLFFISLTLITLAIITYLIKSESSASSASHQIHNPIAANESEAFNLSLQSAAQQLERAASLTNSASCRQRLQIGTLNLREAIRIWPNPSGKQRVQMENWIVAAEESIESCLDGDQSDDGVRAALIGAAADLRDRGSDKMWSGLWKSVGDVILENMIVVCACGLQMLFIFFLYWTIVKSP